jgi:hypothetical protein
MLSRRQAKESFHQQMEQLRMKVDSLPENLRPHFHSLLDQREEDCLRLRKEMERTCGLADDLSLKATHIMFSLEATWREWQQQRS